ncbi:MAG: gamma-glutamyltransferase [Planctomycetota bacterium]
MKCFLGAALACAAAVLLAACKSDAAFQKEATWPIPKHGAVVSEHPLATRAGLDVLNRGGNAADAAVATALALAVAYPQAGNLGGGGFALFVAHTGVASAIDFRETAPAAAAVARFLGSNGELVSARAVRGPLSVAVPGSPAGLYELFREHGSGRFSLADLARPAIELATRGFTVDGWLARDLSDLNVRARMNSAALALFYPGGKPLAEGALLRQPELATTLALYANAGPSAFYRGRIADLVVAELAAARVPESTETGAGWITSSDLASYRAIPRTPLRGWFRGMEIVAMPPPSSGGVMLLQVLGMLEGLPLDAEREHARAAHALEPSEPRDDPGLSDRMVHWWIEAQRRAFADRAAHLGDPDLVNVPLTELLAHAWIAERRVSIGEVAEPAVAPWAPVRESMQTTHLSVLDAQGNAVSLTTTLNSRFGSGILVRGAGFLLNNEIDDFAIAPNAPNQFGLVGAAANALQPGKRPLSTMTPTVVRDGGHANTTVIGSMGGPRILSSVAQVLLRIFVLEEVPERAIRAPRFHQQWNPLPTSFERGFDPALVAALAGRRGHPVDESSETFGSVQLIHLAEPGAQPAAISDPRRGGAGAVQGKPMSTPAVPPP